MPAATTTDFFSSASPNTQASIIADIQQGMTDLGYSTTYDQDLASTTQFLVYEIVFNASSKGKIYLIYYVGSTLVVNSKIADNWNISTHSSDATARNLQTAYTFSSTTTIQYITISASELKLLIMIGSSTQILGWFRPANKPDWWDENKWSYGFIPFDNALNRFLGSKGSGSPYGTQGQDYYPLNFVINQNSLSSSFQDIRLAYANPVTGIRDFIAGCLLYSPFSSGGGYGIAGKCSNDLIQASAVGTARMDRLVVNLGSEEYLLIGSGNSCLGVRIV